MRSLRNIGAIALLAGTALSGACSQTPVLVPLRSMERPKDVDFICLHQLADHWEGASLEKCAVTPDQGGPVSGGYHLHAVVTQISRGELAVADVGTFPTDSNNTSLIKVDPRIPGYSFLPVGAVPSDVVADPMGKAVFVASGSDPRIDIIPAELLRGPIDTTAEQGDESPWPHIALDPKVDGVASGLAIVREGDTRKLYVVLTDAKDATGKQLPPKIAVYDLGENALTPTKIGDIALDTTNAPDLPWAPLNCGPTSFDFTNKTVTRPGDPWWIAYEKQCFPDTPPSPVSSGSYKAPAATESHLAGIAVASGKIFAADDKSPVIHVFDAATGREERRIPVGSPTSRVAISPPVPDEVDVHNVRGIDICQELKFFGDGLDHSDNATIKATLGGRCNLHRYLYAIDFFDPIPGNGSIAIVDFPVTFAPSPAGGPDRSKETIDFAHAQLAQPMGCDSPNLTPTRLPLGPIGVGGVNSAPARAITFLTIDPPTSTSAIPAARCRAWDRAGDPIGDTTLIPHPDAKSGQVEFEGVSAAAADTRTAAGRYWRDFVGPTILRGTYGFVALDSGAVVMVDLDDYDATCRGPQVTPKSTTISLPDGQPVFAYPGEKAENMTLLGPHATSEYYPRVFARHRPHSRFLYDINAVPAVTAVNLSRSGVGLNNDPTADTGKDKPHFAPMGVAGGGNRAFALPAADNPYGMTNEVWTVTYEGMLPGFINTIGSLSLEGGVLTLADPNGLFCQRGTEDGGATPESHDMIELTDDVCTDGVCPGTTKTFDECRAIFGDGTETPRKNTRTMFISKAFDDKVTLVPPKDLDALRSCFGISEPGKSASLHHYVVRASGTWVVLGSQTGYLHRRIIDPASPDKACTDDLTRPRVYDGRVRKQLPPLPIPSQSFTDAGIPPPCDQFVNPVWRFAIRSGALPSERDMQFAFGSRYLFTPFAIIVGQIPQTIKSMSIGWDGEEKLNWSMIASVDAVERGLYMFTANQPFTFQKSVN
jgi:hypothetical protein